ncbi:response regulator [Kallotenue papyrolyticum]|uniref:response regulator n=1 Tax=Kallotenue papyrolyticum TaxID=1325125 RepID=UPI000492808C|nr:response regulator transcription factor [Kallotenue papyrolyticum]
MQHILVVDDEAAITSMVEQRLRRDGFAVVSVGTGAAALAALQRQPFAAVLLDLGLPDMDGLDVLRHLRATYAYLPVIILTARGDEVDRVVGLELGADDYVVKPFSPRELVARVRALLRRTAEAEALRRHAQAGSPPAGGLVRIDALRRVALFREQPLDLRPREFDLLHLLVSHPGQVWTREALLRQVWGVDQHIDIRTVDVHVRRLRAKLAAIDASITPIQTEWGVGYRWVE